MLIILEKNPLPLFGFSQLFITHSPFLTPSLTSPISLQIRTVSRFLLCPHIFPATPPASAVATRIIDSWQLPPRLFNVDFFLAVGVDSDSAELLLPGRNFATLVKMVSRNDPVESFLNSIQVVKAAFSPLELGFRQAAKDLESCWVKVLDDAFCAYSMIGGDYGSSNKITIRSSAKRRSVGGGSNENGVIVEEREGFLSIRVPDMSFLGMFSLVNFENGIWNGKELKHVPLECFAGCVLEQLILNLQKLDQSLQGSGGRGPDHLKAITSIWEGRKNYVIGFLGNLSFARVGGIRSCVVGASPAVDEGCDDGTADGVNVETEGSVMTYCSDQHLPHLNKPATPVETPAGSVLKSALAGGLSCALSCFIMHPVDTIKTQVQASTTLTFTEIISKLPQVGVRGLYRGSIPAVVGQFSSHGLRTGIFEVCKLVLINVAPQLPEIQVQSIASFCGTLLGTASRIPSEVLKQRLQAGLFDNVGEGIVCTWQQYGLNGFFRGSGATLCREVPFYVAGMGLYAESIKAVRKLLGRELEPWETIMVGALSGGLTAIVTTPLDVVKTRMMTAPQGRPISMMMIAFSILQHEGPLGLFKGAVPRFFWVAPLGAMNFAGYELARKAMDN